MDASIIEAPSSTKNRTRERDPEMHQTKKGNQWHFGMKAHIGVDSETGIVHSLSTTGSMALPLLLTSSRPSPCSLAGGRPFADVSRLRDLIYHARPVGDDIMVVGKVRGMLERMFYDKGF